MYSPVIFLHFLGKKQLDKTVKKYYYKAMLIEWKCGQRLGMGVSLKFCYALKNDKTQLTRKDETVSNIRDRLNAPPKRTATADDALYGRDYIQSILEFINGTCSVIAYAGLVGGDDASEDVKKLAARTDRVAQKLLVEEGQLYCDYYRSTLVGAPVVINRSIDRWMSLLTDVKERADVVNRIFNRLREACGHSMEDAVKMVEESCGQELLSAAQVFLSVSANEGYHVLMEAISKAEAAGFTDKDRLEEADLYLDKLANGVYWYLQNIMYNETEGIDMKESLEGICALYDIVDDAAAIATDLQRDAEVRIK